MTSNPYENLTDDEFDQNLIEILDEMKGAQILAIEGAYEVFSEELNDEVLTRWEARETNESTQ